MRPLILSLAFVLMPLFGAAHAQGSQSLDLELNNSVQHDGVCRLSFMVRNGLSVPVTDLGLEVVLLNKDGLAQDFMMLRTGELISGKRRIRQFDLPDIACGDIGEILINDVADCQGEDLTPASCLVKLKPSSRTAIKLGL
ncbi:MAG: hypothetical protein OIF58_17345 [Cohaesibacter sp.]|nr:hypothetical protein [Cohaesibacter sp.]